MNIMDYMDWRGDLGFQESPFNEVDNLILTQLSYVDLDDIVPEAVEHSISVKEASDIYFKGHDIEVIAKDKSATKRSPLILKKAADTARFSGLRLSAYISETDYEAQKQFSAMHILLPDGSKYIAYRGTDDTLIGWKEDFNMSFIPEVPSQLAAVRYLDVTAGGGTEPLYVGGHSKGGNLAIYAAMLCDAQVRDRIIRIYNNDGPGFHRDVATGEAYQAVAQKIITLVPQSSVVGMLLEREGEYQVVKSAEVGLLQHNAISWEVLGPGFVYLNEVTKESRMFDEALNAWIHNMTVEQREQFVDTLFGVLDATGAKTLTDLSTGKLKRMNALIKSFTSLDAQTSDMMLKTVKLLASECRRTLRGAKGIQIDKNRQ